MLQWKEEEKSEVGIGAMDRYARGQEAGFDRCAEIELGQN
jgi:hypothetical protein